jgi:outer membrane protein assembly factor BamB
MPKLSDRLFIGVGGHIVAIDPGTGEEIWRTKLKTSGLALDSSLIATVSVAGSRVYGAAGGELFCLDPTSGDILWRNRLKRLGMGVVTFPGTSDAVALAASVAEQRRAAAAAL